MISIQRSAIAGTVISMIMVGAYSSTLAGVGHDGGQEQGYSFGAPGTIDAVDRTIRVVASDTAFDVAEMHIHAGETIRFIVANEGEIDHDFTIGPAAMQAKHRQEMMEMMDGNDGMANMHSDANAVYLRPGETKELIWTFGKVHDLEFACNVAGHYESGMKGLITETDKHEPAS